MNEYKTADPVTVVDGSNFLVNKRGFVVKTIPKPVTDPLVGNINRNIIVSFPDIPIRSFPACGDSRIPEEEWGWVYFEEKDLVLGHAPLTFEEQIEKELSSFGSMKPWARFLSYPDRLDHKCVCEGCNNFASTHIWFNIWGSGYRYNVCRWHAEEFKPCSCREEIPFKAKPDDNKPKEKVA